VSLSIVAELCIDCGACEFGCPTEAIHRPAPEDRPQAFWIETNRCNDCGWCPTVCPADAIIVDPDTIVCSNRGCPVAPTRRGPVAGWACTQMLTLCEGCGHVLWRSDDDTAWRCPRCGSDLQVTCPKILRHERGEIGQRPRRRDVDEIRSPSLSPG